MSTDYRQVIVQLKSVVPTRPRLSNRSERCFCEIRTVFVPTVWPADTGIVLFWVFAPVPAVGQRYVCSDWFVFSERIG